MGWWGVARPLSAQGGQPSMPGAPGGDGEGVRDGRRARPCTLNSRRKRGCGKRALRAGVVRW